ncbi:MAG: hypothetical protein FJZ95_02590 [Chloroflexi bacterium]|nr:hypothetical protein [Chloroflexota bacterium]
MGVAPVGEDLTGRIPPYTWDADVRIFHLTSQAGEATVEARTAKNELRKMPAAINGDYVAAGATLMINNDGDNYLDAFVSGNQSSATVDSIPDDAQVELAYLYWSGWFANGTTIWGPDACADFSNWTRSSTPGNQTRVPTADGDISGTWNTAPCWDDVDETSPDDGNYMAGTTDSGGYKLFTFSPFTIPAGATVMNLTVYVRAKDVSSGTNNIRPSIKVNGTRYNTTATSVNPSTSFTTYSYAYSSNPNTGSPWTAEDVNGTGTCPLQQFGVYSSDLNPDIQVSMVYAQVNYEEAGWTISSGRFQGHYSGGSDAYRYLTKTVSTDLSAYATGAVYVYWDQYESGTLEATDGLDFQFSADGGSTWSGLITAFRDDLSTSAFSYAIPPTYLTAGFKMRFYLQGFGDSGEYCYIDNIKLTSLMPDTSVVFKINGEQVYLDGDGLATQGAVEVTAGRSSAMPNAEVAGSFSYACRLEVTKLLKAFSDEGAEGNHTGNATYTVGNVNATVNNDWSYAAWSILIIYSSAESYGHQLYLYDVFSYAGEDGNVDFDHDGQPGGTIGGFIVPDPIAAEVDAAKLSCFVGEGDNAYTGDYLRFNGTSLSNAQSPSNNVWNSNSPGLTQAGIDIDTFSISWASGLLEPGDTSAQIDMPTGNDSWNLVYTIISFRSETSTGGAITYLLEL